MTKMKKQNQKLVAALLFLVGAIGITASSMVAYFSDFVSAGGVVTAGTLDIDGSFTMRVNGGNTVVTSVANFNPGDYVKATGAITNNGNKSAWLRTGLSFSSIPPEIGQYIKVYTGDCNFTAGLNAPTGCTAANTNAAGAYGDPVVLDGTGANAEQETQTEIDTITGTNGKYLAVNSNVFASVVTIVFDPSATNSAQGKTVDFAVNAEALQFRNNPNPNWSVLEQI
jgi:hypothetical protein